MTASHTTTAGVELFERWKEDVRAEWTDPATVAGWTKWRSPFVQFGAEAKQALLEAARIQPAMDVLDIASGTGEPALTLAELVGPTGRVTATDLGPGMLTIAEQEARKAALQNLSFAVADVHELPFADQSFERVTCRFGIIYFADTQRALGECRRVLRPGGRVAFTAWGPLEKNPFILCALDPFLKRVEVPEPPPGAPGPFRYAERGSLRDELERAGFEEVEEELRLISMPFPGSPADFWQFFYDIAVPFHPIIESLDRGERERAIAEAISAYARYETDDGVTTPAEIVVCAGAR